MTWLPVRSAEPETRGARVYLAALLVLVGAFSLAVSIGRDDTDLWYHLNAGRYILAQHALPHVAWFSFLEPAPVVVDYSWLFDAMVWLVYSAAGFGGLVVLRTALLLGAIALAIDLLAEPALREPDAAARARRLAWAAVASTGIALLFVLRARDVRPHLVATLAMVALVWLFWRRPRAVIAPFAVALVWTNAHGASYPLLVVVVVAALVDRVLSRPREEKDLRPILSCVAPLLAILLTPNLFALVMQPFVPVALAQRFIQEMAPIPLDAMPSFVMTRAGLSDVTLLQLVALAGAMALLVARRTSARVAPALLYAAGLAILFRGQRHTSDFAVLVLPALRDMRLPAIPLPVVSRIPREGWAALAIVVLAAQLGTRLDDSRRPFTRERLPEGVCRFVEAHVPGDGVRLLQRPEVGAYYEWRLPHARIAMDMQLATVFRYDDYFALRTAQHDAGSLQKALETWKPDLVAQRRELADPPIARVEGWRAVFFDDADVLYADLARHPELAPFALSAVDPHRIDALSPGAMAPDARASALSELERVLAVDPNGVLANVAASRLLAIAGRHEDALRHAESALVTAPGSIAAREEQGNALLGLRRIAEAEDVFTALAGERTERTPLFRRRLAQCAVADGRHADAYAQLLEAWGGWPEAATHADLYELAASAARAGKNDDAVRWLRYAWLKAPAGDVEWRTKIEERLTALGAR